MSTARVLRDAGAVRDADHRSVGVLGRLAQRATGAGGYLEIHARQVREPRTRPVGGRAGGKTPGSGIKAGYLADGGDPDLGGALTVAAPAGCPYVLGWRERRLPNSTWDSPARIHQVRVRRLPPTDTVVPQGGFRAVEPPNTWEFDCAASPRHHEGHAPPSRRESVVRDTEAPT